MKVHFWGVRGSIPTPVSPLQIQTKIQSVIQHITPKDIESNIDKENFVSSLPRWIYGTVGGNTACVQVISNHDIDVIIDAGSGIRLLGKKLAGGTNPIHIFISHFHWDHIQGLPFFDPLFDPNREIHFYSFSENGRNYLKEQMENPFFPVPLDICTKKMYFHCLQPNEPFVLGNLQICAKEMYHPGGCFCYSFIEDDKKFIYASDVEISLNDFQNDKIKDSFFENADALVLDSQYTLGEAVVKQNWGHTPFCYAVDFASLNKVKKLYLFHHEPNYDDKKLFAMLDSAKFYKEFNVKDLTMAVDLAMEGMEFDL